GAEIIVYSFVYKKEKFRYDGLSILFSLLLVLGSEYDGTYTWYQVDYNGQTGYVRSDMAQMLTIAELQAYLNEQASATPKPGASATTAPNSGNNTSYVINGTPLQDLIPVDDSWTNNVMGGMPSYATATPDPSVTPTPEPPATPAALIGSYGNLTVVNVPAMTQSGTFQVYGTAKAFAQVKATVEVPVATSPTATPATLGASLIASAVAENAQTVKKTVGQTIADANGRYTMDVTLPSGGEYIVEFTSDDGSYARYGVTYDTGATPEPTIAPLPTAEPLKEESGMGMTPFIIGGVLLVIAAAVYGIYLYRRKTEEDEDEEDEDEETELREEQLSQQRLRRAEQAGQPVRAPKAPQQGQGAQVPAYMKNIAPRAPQDAPAAQSHYARPAAPNAPVAPQRPAAPNTPVAPQRPAAPVAPNAPVAPQRPAAPNAPVAPTAPAVPTAPKAPESEPAAAPAEGTVRRRRRPPVDPNA
ncbi:MAG: hypothetical protein MR821_05265, partial [Clostridiales bacterium]|nr:hypothetical protein [Clostridiales bacterium]